MEATEIRKLAQLEDTHWWYRERRAILARQLRKLGVKPGRALDVGAAGGGNTRVLRAHGWDALAVEYSDAGVEVARERGLNVIQADARDLPLEDGSFDLVMAFDILEHIEEDVQAASEFHRVLKPGGHALIAVPCDMRLWSAHDVAVDHVRRYDREGLVACMTKAGFEVDEVWSWNVLLRPVAAARRKKSTGSDLSQLPWVVNFALTVIIAAERYLPVRNLPGVSLVLRAHKPTVPA
ncbi:MAG TPA: class I SAM-dependent methyltransferase [Candidatus Limnocylindrales bacterium]|nr:class I SAM-dependent methyltransferase [Candidatus Limnocylindrales bacterium]